MKNLNELLEETEFTQDEWKTYRKVQKNCQLQDLEYLLDEMLENEEISIEKYKLACEKAEYIVEKYNSYDDYDWQINMQNAIYYILED